MVFIFIFYPNLVDNHSQVCGVPDQRLGEVVCAWIKLKSKSDQIAPKEIIDFCAKKVNKGLK